MKIIELLNKIANGEEDDLTTEFEFDKRVWNFYKFKNESEFCLDGWLLNQNITITKHKKILEEEKKIKPLTKKDIEALGYACGEIQKCFTNGWSKSLKNKSLEEEKKIPEKLKWNEKSQHNVVTDNTKKALEHLLSRSEQLKKSINEIIDYLKSKGDE